MATTSQIIIMFLLLVVAISVPFALSAVDHVYRLGGYRPIGDLNAMDVQDAAKFAVSEFNKQQQSQQVNKKPLLLQYRRIVRGESQQVAGINYKLVVMANNGESEEQYEVVVYRRLWKELLKLVSFKKVQGRGFFDFFRRV